MPRKLDIRKTVLLVSAAMAVLTMVFGLLDPPLGRAQAQAGVGAPQSGATAPQSFEVASIKPSAGDGRMVSIGISPGGRYTASGVTVKMLIQQAYDIRDFQISGGPSWMSSEKYDIVAKAETPNLDRDRIKVLLQSLLAERFKLQVHRENKELPIYVLVVGKNVHKLHASEVQPGPQTDNPPPDARKAGEPGPLARAAAGAEGGLPPKGGSQIRMGRGQLNAQMATVSSLAAMLSQQLGRPVLDKTDLKGNFDFNLEWTPDETQRGLGFGGIEKPAADTAPPGDSSGPSIFTALQKQLGLKLESQKGPVEILVIDRIEKPTEN